MITEREVEHEPRGLRAEVLAASLAGRDGALRAPRAWTISNSPAVPTGAVSPRRTSS